MRRNQEAVSRHRQISSAINLSEKRKLAQKRWEKCVEEYENEIREYYKVDNISEKFCKTCHLHISKQNVPKLALTNGLDFPIVDKILLKLNRLEERLLSARHVFQTLWTVKGPVGQYKTKGGIVNVPVNIDTTVNKLPRALNDTHMIHVRLARKLEYVKNYMSGIVRPKLLFRAAQALVRKPLLIEEGIELSNTWSNDNFQNDDMTLYDAEDEFYTDNAIHETLLTHDSLAFNSLASKGVRIAPAENYKPQSVLFDHKCEFLAFPTVFGGFRMDPQINGKNIPYSDFAKSIATRYDRRVSGRGDLLLFIAKKLELLKLYNNIGICLKKKKLAGKSITAGDMLRKSYVDGLVQHNEGYKILKGVRSSPAHWMQEKVKLLAQIRQFGLPTLFVTLSAADTKWPELLVALKMSVDKESISEEDAQKMSYKDRAILVQKDPITCALHFDQRFRAIRRSWNNTDGPFIGHTISHSYYRIEFQQRG
ncbi:hypothetical protein FOCC_FOCC015417 [Frankliniella occidentalis]|nr:hypothetical protein FOCC_FOCC015417 [Frankliniella occidentalis]